MLTALVVLIACGAIAWLTSHRAEVNELEAYARKSNPTDWLA